MPETPLSDDPFHRPPSQPSFMRAMVEVALLLVTGIAIVAAGVGASLIASQLYATRVSGAGLGDTTTLGMIVMQTVVVLATLGVARLHGTIGDTLRLRSVAGGGRSLKQVAVVGAVFLIVSTALALLVYPESFRRDLETFRPLLQSPFAGLAIVAVAIGAPLSEELLFRGYLLTGLGRARMAFVPAAVVTAGTWMLLHLGYSPTGLAEVFLAGLMLAWVMRLTDSLWVPITVHALYNVAALAIMYVMIL